MFKDFLYVQLVNSILSAPSELPNFQLYTVICLYRFIISTTPARSTEYMNQLPLERSLPFCPARTTGKTNRFISLNREHESFITEFQTPFQFVNQLHNFYFVTYSSEQNT